MDAEMTQIQTDFTRIKSQLELYIDELRAVMDSDPHILLTTTSSIGSKD